MMMVAEWKKGRASARESTTRIDEQASEVVTELNPGHLSNSDPAQINEGRKLIASNNGSINNLPLSLFLPLFNSSLLSALAPPLRVA
jgi:hypothetical protein